MSTLNNPCFVTQKRTTDPQRIVHDWETGLKFTVYMHQTEVSRSDVPRLIQAGFDHLKVVYQQSEDLAVKAVAIELAKYVLRRVV